MADLPWAPPPPPGELFPALPADMIAAHVTVMEDFIAGRRSWWNSYASPGGDQIAALAACATADAATAVAHAEAVRAYAALLGTGWTAPPGVTPESVTQVPR